MAGEVDALFGFQALFEMVVSRYHRDICPALTRKILSRFEFRSKV